MNRHGTSVAGILLAGAPVLAPYAAFAATDDVSANHDVALFAANGCRLATGGAITESRNGHRKPKRGGRELSFPPISAAIILCKTDAQRIVLYSKRNIFRESFNGG